MKRSAYIMITGVVCILFLSIFQASASPEMNKFVSEVVWRADGQGDYVFQGNGSLKGVKIAADGGIEYDSAPGTYELIDPYIPDGLILSLTANWTFTGKVTLEVSVTGSADGYVAITNGVPYEYNSKFGSKIKWRVTLAEGSKLKTVTITYKDIAGTLGSWGNPKLCGFGFRKAIFINGSKSGELYNYEVPIKVGQAQAENCDLTLKGIVAADFHDICFTQADAKTILPHYLESVGNEAARKRTAVVWVKVPQVPVAGLPIYIYYGRPEGADLSSAKETFDFFDDFQSGAPDVEAWQAYDFKQVKLEYKLRSSDEIKSLDTAKLNKEEILGFFKEGKDFEWARARAYVSPAPLIDKEKSKATQEEVPNLADFSGIEVAPDGDLVLTRGSKSGEYTSPTVQSLFMMRVMAPEYKASVSAASTVSIDISANAGKDFKENCLSDKYYYASRKDFSSGDSLRWRLHLSREDVRQPGSTLKEFGVDVRPGVISVISPEAGEKLSGASAYNIKWSAQEYEPSYVMGLAYSLDDGKNYSVITENALNTGKYLWKIPQKIDQKVVVKVYDKLDPAVNATSNGYFSMAGVGVGTGEIAAKSGGSKEPTKEAVKESPVGTETEKTVQTMSEKAKAEKLALEMANAPAGKQLYDLLIMPKDSSSPGQKTDKNSYKKGDIVVIMPAGGSWSDAEQRSYLVVRAYLSREEAAGLLQPNMVTKGVDKNGKPAYEVQARRKFRVNLNKQGLVGKRHKDLFDSNPMLKTEAIENEGIQP